MCKLSSISVIYTDPKGMFCLFSPHTSYLAKQMMYIHTNNIFMFISCLNTADTERYYGQLAACTQYPPLCDTLGDCTVRC